MRTRHLARRIALQALYEIDMTGHDPEATMSRHLGQRELSQESKDFVRELVLGVLASRATLDDLIGRFAPAWPVEQISPIDRNVLRLAIFEILHHNSVSVKVAINEAVELAKAFGSESSPKFVNGVLGSVANLVASQKAG